MDIKEKISRAEMFRSRNYNDQMRYANPNAVAAASALGNIMMPKQPQSQAQPQGAKRAPVRSSSMMNMRRGSLLRKPEEKKSTPSRTGSLVQRKPSITNQKRHSISSTPQSSAPNRTSSLPTKRNSLVSRSGSFTRRMKNAQSTFNEFGPQASGVANVRNSGEQVVKMVTKYIPGKNGLIAVQVPATTEQPRKTSSLTRRPGSMTSISNKNGPKRKISQQSLHSHSVQQSNPQKPSKKKEVIDSSNPEDSFNRAVDKVDESVPLIETSMREETEQELLEQTVAIDESVIKADENPAGLQNLLEDNIVLEETMEEQKKDGKAPLENDATSNEKVNIEPLPEVAVDSTDIPAPLEESERQETNIAPKEDSMKEEIEPEAPDNTAKNITEFDSEQMKDNKTVTDSINELENIPGTMDNEMQELKESIANDINSQLTTEEMIDEMEGSKTDMMTTDLNEKISEAELSEQNLPDNNDSPLLKQQKLEENKLKESIEAFGKGANEGNENNVLQDNVVGNDITLQHDIVTNIRSNETVSSPTDSEFVDSSSVMENDEQKENVENLASKNKSPNKQKPQNMAQYLRSANPYLTTGGSATSAKKSPATSPKKQGSSGPIKSAMKKSSRPLSTTSSVYSDINSPADGAYLSLTTAENTRINAKLAVEEPIDWHPNADKSKRASMPVRSSSKLYKKTSNSQSQEKVGYNRSSRQYQGPIQTPPNTTKTPGGVTKMGVVSAAALSSNNNAAAAEDKSNRQSLLKNRALEMAKQVNITPKKAKPVTPSVPSSTVTPPAVNPVLNAALYPKEPLQKKSSFEKLRNTDKNLGFKKLSLRDSAFMDGADEQALVNAGSRNSMMNESPGQAPPKLATASTNSGWKSRFQDSDSDVEPVQANAAPVAPPRSEERVNGFSLFKKKSNTGGNTFLKPPQPDFSAGSEMGEKVSRTSSYNSSPNKTLNNQYSKGSLRSSSMQTAGPGSTAKPNIFANIEETEKRIYSNPEVMRKDEHNDEGVNHGFGKKLKKLFGRKKH